MVNTLDVVVFRYPDELADGTAVCVSSVHVVSVLEAGKEGLVDDSGHNVVSVSSVHVVSMVVAFEDG
jgi:hypothetical protein